MSSDRAKRAQMRDDILELATAMGYEIEYSEGYWELREPCGCKRYEGGDADVHPALRREARLRAECMPTIRAVIGYGGDEPELDEPIPLRPSEPGSAESLVGRVYQENTRHPAAPVAYVANQAGPAIIIVHSGGRDFETSRAELDKHWTHRPDHPMATDPPREDGLGWREGDEYTGLLGSDGIEAVRKYRAGVLIAEAPSNGDIVDGKRLTFVPQWKPITTEPTDADHALVDYYVYSDFARAPGDLQFRNLLTWVEDHKCWTASPEQLRDALQAAGWHQTDDQVETWVKS